MINKHVLELPSFDIEKTEQIEPNMNFLNFSIMSLFEQEASINIQELYTDIECYKDPWKTD